MRTSCLSLLGIVLSASCGGDDGTALPPDTQSAEEVATTTLVDTFESPTEVASATDITTDVAAEVVVVTPPEICNGIDDDGDGLTDEGVTARYFRDFDGDHEGDRAATVPACQLADGLSTVGTDCDDHDAAVHTGAAEACNGKDDDCDGLTDEGWDGDHDGFTSCGGDCRDDDASVHPRALERCLDRVDSNCSGATQEGCARYAGEWCGAERGMDLESCMGHRPSLSCPAGYDHVTIDAGDDTLDVCFANVSIAQADVVESADLDATVTATTCGVREADGGGVPCAGALPGPDSCPPGYSFHDYAGRLGVCLATSGTARDTRWGVVLDFDRADAPNGVTFFGFDASVNRCPPGTHLIRSRYSACVIP